MLKIHWKLISLMTVACLAGCNGAAATNEGKKVSIEQVPAAVKATILAQTQGGAIKEIEKETEKGQFIYEAEVVIGGREVEIRVANNGTLLGTKTESEDKDNEKEGDDDDDDEKHEKNEKEEIVTLDAVPAAVKATIQKEAAGAEIKEIEKETEDGKTIYSAEVLIKGQIVDLKIAPDGKFLGKKVETEDDDK